jgi:hypothetical protein
MADWNTRLAVSYQEQDGGPEVQITPIDSFSPTFSLNAEVLNSIEDTHLGVVYTPQAMTFSMTVKAIGDVAAKLTALAFAGTRFDVILQEADGSTGSDWSFKNIVMADCVITSASPSPVMVSGAPAATFSGFSLRAKAEPKTGPVSNLP